MAGFRPYVAPQQRRPGIAALEYTAPPAGGDDPPIRLRDPALQALHPSFWPSPFPQQRRRCVAAVLAPEPEIPVDLDAALTSAQIVALLQASDLTIESGADLLDADESWLADVSGDLERFELSRNVFRQVHGVCRFKIARRLQWQRHRLRPWVTFSSLTENLTATWTRGVWVLGTPSTPLGWEPITYEGDGWDKLVLADTPCGRSYSVAAGSDVLAAVESILSTEIANAGTVQLDQSSAGVTSNSDRVWAPNVTWLTVCNELLASIGYEGLWCDPDGTWRARPYRQPSERGATWSFDADNPLTSIVGEDRVLLADLTDVPNVWVGYRRDVDTPTDGAGRYELANLTDGDTSVAGRAQRRITRVESFDAVDQASLETQVRAMAAADREVAVRLQGTIGPVPVLWHLDVVELTDSQVPGSSRWAVEEWSHDLTSTDDMAVRLRQVVTL